MLNLNSHVYKGECILIEDIKYTKEKTEKL